MAKKRSAAQKAATKRMIAARKKKASRSVRRVAKRRTPQVRKLLRTSKLYNNKGQLRGMSGANKSVKRAMMREKKMREKYGEGSRQAKQALKVYRRADQKAHKLHTLHNWYGR
jgi:hypothetical protein